MPLLYAALSLEIYRWLSAPASFEIVELGPVPVYHTWQPTKASALGNESPDSVDVDKHFEKSAVTVIYDLALARSLPVIEALEAGDNLPPPETTKQASKMLLEAIDQLNTFENGLGRSTSRHECGEAIELLHTAHRRLVAAVGWANTRMAGSSAHQLTTSEAAEQYEATAVHDIEGIHYTAIWPYLPVMHALEGGQKLPTSNADKAVKEGLLQALEALDALDLQSDWKDARDKRNQTVQRIQAALERLDAAVENAETRTMEDSVNKAMDAAEYAEADHDTATVPHHELKAGHEVDEGADQLAKVPVDTLRNKVESVAKNKDATVAVDQTTSAVPTNEQPGVAATEQTDVDVASQAVLTELEAAAAEQNTHGTEQSDTFTDAQTKAKPLEAADDGLHESWVDAESAPAPATSES